MSGGLSIVDYQNAVAEFRNDLERAIRGSINGSAELAALKDFKAKVAKLTDQLEDCDFKRAFGLHQPGIAFLNPIVESQYLNMLTVG